MTIVSILYRRDRNTGFFDSVKDFMTWIGRPAETPVFRRSGRIPGSRCWKKAVAAPWFRRTVRKDRVRAWKKGGGSFRFPLERFSARF